MALDGILTTITSKKKLTVGEIVGVKEPVYTDGKDWVHACDNDKPEGWKSRPSFMAPREAVRTFLEVVACDGSEYDVKRVERPVEGLERRKFSRIEELEMRIEVLERKIEEMSENGGEVDQNE